MQSLLKRKQEIDNELDLDSDKNIIVADDTENVEESPEKENDKEAEIEEISVWKFIKILEKVNFLCYNEYTKRNTVMYFKAVLTSVKVKIKQFSHLSKWK